MERGQSYESYFLMSVWPKQRPKLLLPGGMISLLCSCHWSGWLVICKPDTKAGGHGVTVGNNERESESMRVCPGAGNIRLSLLVRMVPRAHGALIPFSLSTHFDQHSFFFQYHIYVWEYSECFSHLFYPLLSVLFPLCPLLCLTGSSPPVSNLCRPRNTSKLSLAELFSQFCSDLWIEMICPSSLIKTPVLLRMMY